MNMGYEDDELKPYLEPEPDYKDHKRIGESASMYINTSYLFSYAMLCQSLVNCCIYRWFF